MKIYRGYQIKPHKQYPAHYIIVTDGKGGKIPDILSGIFTSVNFCMAEIDAYLLSKSKDAKNAEATE